MLDQLKRKRLSLTHNFQPTRPRRNSVEKRRQIQANLQKFKKEVSESKPIPSYQSANNFYPMTNEKKSEIQLNQSPTMKDLISPFKNNAKQNNIKQKSEEIQSPRFKNNENIIEQKNEQNIQNNSLKHHQTPYQSPLKQNSQKIQQDHNKSPNQNIYDNSFQNEKPQLYKISPKPLNQRHLSFGNQQQLPSQNINLPNNSQLQFSNNNTPKSNNSNIKNSKVMQPTYEKKQQHNQLNFDYNQSKYGSSSNGSSAIFYTSQFRQYINRDPSQTNPQPTTNNQQDTFKPITQQSQSQKQSSDPKYHKSFTSQNHPHTDKQINQSFLKLGEQQLSQITESGNKKLQHIASGRSLAFSNIDQSNLKQSKANQYSKAVQDMFHKKLDQQLVMEIQQFGKNKMNLFISQYDNFMKNKSVKIMCKDFKLLKNYLEFCKNRNRQLMRYCFDAFIMLKQYKFQQVKNDIKADKFVKQSNQKLLKNVFQQWKLVPLERQKIIVTKVLQDQQKLKKNVFQIFRRIWYDTKIKNQANLYYLSKLFAAMRSTLQKQSKKQENMALKHYCKSLKRTYFNLMQQGIENLRKQRQNQQLAEQHYKYVMMKKFFDAWLDKCQKSPQYISLTMTSRNLFKQTQDNKWLGIKTVDFRQFKQ